MILETVIMHIPRYRSHRRMLQSQSYTSWQIFEVSGTVKRCTTATAATELICLLLRYI